MTNKDMALSRTDAMDRCISLGKQFIQHFDKIFKNPNDPAKSHWISEMQNWYKKVKEIKLKQSNDYILSGELRDWFFTAGANPQDFMQNPTNEELKLYDNFTNKLISGNNIQTALRSINIMDKKIKDNTITKTVDLGNYSRYDSLIMKKANDYSLKLDGTGHTVKVIGEPENINDFVQFINEYHRANAKILDSKSFMVKYMDRTFKVKAKDHQDAANKVIKNMKDARPDENTISSIEKAARNFRANNISVVVNTDVDKDGVFIEEMYISTSGKWLETPQEADAYLRDLSNAVKFLKENYKYLGK